ncbi:MAG: ABC transporter permease [Aurantimonas coralicida]|jgi:peptide/nickel transport system permease protein|uniref:Putative permease protein, ABC-type oligopeptide transporter n=1 Tax=Aurantimonas manganoxydans (strain ATCC BAA-1229 / DSM 21871 / SI85-9A1) TaxID=287752 RepID=Q1YLC7_AURMS|nr:MULTISPECIES: ABC transporter permease [Aurantimonas]MCW7542539.1 ABC transporter permease [Aurantimonas litoralis]EAS51804.1 putative permease protein, ABC-type oligopeptide transporter [Aurantimonas manganoxydans SI85-9A1]MCC4297372.1 ABC transporter permease [Aurantimonas coralicida]MCD1641597.1 ABC transporter permease [Aurantimonas coralicida]MDE0922489.1 ABC transporter permease [Aurantimonas coralicida]
MLFFILKRLLVTFLVVAVTSVIAFLLVHMSGDPAAAMAGEGASASDIAAVRELFGFDRPLILQYLDWIGRLLQGDFGRSYYLRMDVVDVLAEHVPVTATLGVLALTFALALSIPLGVLAALRPNTVIDRISLWLAVAGQALPSFLFALGLMYLFGVYLRWLPISGDSTWAHFIMPSVALGYYATPAIMRLTRSGMLDVMQADHVRTARAYGLTPWRVVVRHGLRHAIVPVVSLAAVQLGFMLGGSIVIETIFSLKGIGHLAWESIQRADIEVIQAILLLIAVAYAILTLVADLLNAALDPRIRIS